MPGTCAYCNATSHWINFKLGLHAKRMAQQNRGETCWNLFDFTSSNDSWVINRFGNNFTSFPNTFMSLHLSNSSSCAPSIVKPKKIRGHRPRAGTCPAQKSTMSSSVQVWRTPTSIQLNTSIAHIYIYIFIYIYVLSIYLPIYLSIYIYANVYFIYCICIYHYTYVTILGIS